MIIKNNRSNVRDDRGIHFVNIVCRAFYSPWKKVEIALSNWLLTAFHFFYSGLFYWGSVKYRFVFAFTFFITLTRTAIFKGSIDLTKGINLKCLLIFSCLVCVKVSSSSFFFFWKKTLYIFLLFCQNVWSTTRKPM